MRRGVRAWHKGLKRMVAVTGLHFFEAGELSSVSFDDPELGEQQDISIKWFEVMESTGLKDKNGVDIYEGDIVETAFGIDVVRYSGNAFVPNDPLHHFIDQTAVIGNIHENPELLAAARHTENPS